jgi:hypothetical protein
MFLGCQFETDFFAAGFEEHNIKVNQNCLYIPSSGGQQHEKSKIHQSIDSGIPAGRLRTHQVDHRHTRNKHGRLGQRSGMRRINSK